MRRFLLAGVASFFLTVPGLFLTLLKLLTKIDFEIFVLYIVKINPGLKPFLVTLLIDAIKEKF